MTDAAAQCTRTNFNLCPIATTPGNPYLSGQATLIDLGSRYMQRLGALSSFRMAPGMEIRAQAGGAETVAERYRVWMEGYGLRSRFDARADFSGDSRKTYGGLAGASVNFAPGLTAGLSIDQSRTDVDITGFAQSGRIDLTQFGAMIAYENGPWNFGINVIRGFGDLHSSRIEFGGQSTTAYQAKLWAAMAELSYFWSLPDNWRFAPRLSFDWTRTRTDAFAETGGFAPVAGGTGGARRVRMLIGGEVGHSWFVSRTIMDFSIYGRLVNNLSQSFETIKITDSVGTNPALFVSGLHESKLGADAGATLSAKISDVMRLYAVYDGRYRSNFTSHSGTAGVEFRF
ncbi:MAG TPA: autotransporter outer membrane beta-barrel domain-containing protein [Bradyrhizobium sp.]|nr:autotransporter outer membrane beta-barrel domain-containing protein [Bradyrhizobium sp.]